MKNSLKYSVITLIFIGVLACGKKDNTAQLDKLKQQRNKLTTQIEQLEAKLKVNVVKPLTSVSVQAFQPQSFYHEIQVQGKIESDRNILVPAEAGGVIKRIYVKEGDKVTSGQTMAQIDNEILLSQIKEVNGNLTLAKDIYERTARLYKQQIGSEVEYLQAKNKMEDLESSLATLQTQLSKTKILAPFTGRVDKVSMKEGEAVSIGTGVIRVVHASKLKVLVNISEDYITSIREGQEVTVNFPTINKQLNLKITSISNVIDSNDRTFTIEIALPSDDDLYPNMYSIVTVRDYMNNNALIIPEKNITAYSGKFYVYMLSENQEGKPIAEFREVKVGKTFNANSEIVAGVKIGEKYISKGFTQLSDSQLIEIN